MAEHRAWVRAGWPEEPAVLLTAGLGGTVWLPEDDPRVRRAQVRVGLERAGFPPAGRWLLLYDPQAERERQPAWWAARLRKAEAAEEAVEEYAFGGGRVAAWWIIDFGEERP